MIYRYLFADPMHLQALSVNIYYLVPLFFFSFFFLCGILLWPMVFCIDKRSFF